MLSSGKYSLSYLKRSQDTILLGICFVQRWVKFNPRLNQNYSSNSFSKEKLTVLIKYCSDFPSKKLVNLKLTGQIRFCEVGNKTMGKQFNPGLAFLQF